MWKIFEWLLGRRAADTRRRWERERLAQELGLFDARASTIVHDVTDKLGVVGTDDRMSDRLGAPDSPYYQTQSAEAFDKEYLRVQARAEKLLKNLPPREI